MMVYRNEKPKYSKIKKFVKLEVIGNILSYLPTNECHYFTFTVAWLHNPSVSKKAEQSTLFFMRRGVNY